MNRSTFRQRALKERREYLMHVQAMERRTAKRLAPLIREMILSASPEFENLKTSNLELEIRKAIVEAASQGVKRGIRRFQSVYHEMKMDTEEELLDRMFRWAMKNSGKKVKSIESGLLSRLRKIVADGVAEDLVMPEIRKNILDLAGDLSRWQAERIARTEIHSASMFGEFESISETADEVGVELFKVWSSGHDQRVRASHERADGQMVPMDKPFKIEQDDGTIVELAFPGDPDGPPEEIINCRCTLTYEPASWEA